MNLQGIEVDASGLADAELDHLARFLEYGATVSEQWPDATRLLLLDLSQQLRGVLQWREGMAWQLEQDLAGKLPDPADPTRRSWPPGWRAVGEEAPGL